MASPDDGDSGPDRSGPSDRPGSSSVEAEIRAEQQAVDRAYERLEHMRRSAIDVVRHHRQLSEASTSQARVEWESLLALTDQRLQHLEFGGAALCFGRIDRNGGESYQVGRISVTDETSTRSSSTGGRRSPSRSTGRRRSSRWASSAAATSRPEGRTLVGLDDEVFDADAAEPSGLTVVGRGRAARRARAQPHRPHGRHRRHHPGRAGRERSAPTFPASWSSPAGPAPARPRSRCTAPPTSSTRTASASRRRACCSSGPSRDRSCATSSTCSRRSARAESSSPRSPG